MWKLPFESCSFHEYIAQNAIRLGIQEGIFTGDPQHKLDWKQKHDEDEDEERGHIRSDEPDQALESILYFFDIISMHLFPRFRPSGTPSIMAVFIFYAIEKESGQRSSVNAILKNRFSWRYA